MTTNTVTPRRKGDPQHYVEGMITSGNSLNNSFQFGHTNERKNIDSNERLILKIFIFEKLNFPNVIWCVWCVLSNKLLLWMFFDEIQCRFEYIWTSVEMTCSFLKNSKSLKHQCIYIYIDILYCSSKVVQQIVV